MHYVRGFLPSGYVAFRNYERGRGWGNWFAKGKEVNRDLKDLPERGLMTTHKEACYVRVRQKTLADRIIGSPREPDKDPDVLRLAVAQHEHYAEQHVRRSMMIMCGFAG